MLTTLAAAQLLALTPSLAQPAQVPQPQVPPKAELPELPAELKASVEALLRGSTVRGAAVVLVDANGPTGALWYGQADAASGVPMTPATCLRAGSVSKTFTALLAMRLADQGKVSLDDPLPPDLQPPGPSPAQLSARLSTRSSAQVVPPAGCDQHVTLAQLLEHTGGVAGSSHADYGTQAGNAPVQPVARQIVGRPLAWCPGLHYSYSNDGITLAAAVLERAGGADFDTLMQREVFAPLGIGGASFATDGLPACVSRSYDAQGGEIAQPWQLAVRPAGALVATPLALARAVQMFLGYGRGADGHVLEPCSVAHMALGSTGLAGRHGAATGAYGRGLFRFQAAGRLMVGHWGRIDGFQTTLGFAPEAGRGMVIMVNTADRSTMYKLREMVAEEVWRGVPAPPLPPLARPAEGIAGWYANASHDMPLRAPWVALLDVVRIEQDNTGLTLRGLWPGVASRRVAAVSETAFREEALPLPSMAFARDDDRTRGSAGTRWWVDGESYRTVAPAWVVGRLLVLALGLLAAAGCLGWFVVSTALHVLRRSRPTLSPPPVAWLALSGGAYLWVFGGYAAFGLFGVGDALAQLGRVGALSLSLVAASLIAPAAAAVAGWALARARSGPWQWGATLLLVALGLLTASLGWVPLVTWQSGDATATPIE